MLEAIAGLSGFARRIGPGLVTSLSKPGDIPSDGPL